ncbi:hypothetical protein AAFF_G00230560 [Aldrovandia affinis]|uniref:Interferon/interleukin receptor domain-containing protein n=1 Tax=Aldrovandia affinis TaxID=143900 RepID=A0AAD7W3S7_9TELE|nr:hypothetical protein AAFF_G00230560 [Aldrovandia affinis]
MCFSRAPCRPLQTDVLNCEQQTRLVLSGLKPGTRYCMQAQVFVPTYHKSSAFSQVLCETNTIDGKVKAWLIAVVMVCSLLGVAFTVIVLFLIGWFGYKGVKFVFPTAKLPENFKQAPHSYIILAMQTTPPPQEQCDEVSIARAPEGSERSEGSHLQPH